MFKIAVRDIDNKEVEQINLDEKVFDGKVKKSVLYQLINMYLANKRRGTAATKTRGEVSGGGKKPWRQKGIGRARVGSSRNPLWTGGGIVFGPHPRNYAYSVPVKIRQLGLRYSINSKLNDKDVIVLKDLAINEPKTKLVNKFLKKAKVDGRCIVVFNSKEDKFFARAARNLNVLTLKRSQDVNAYEILASDKLIMTKTALEDITARIKNHKKRAK